MNRALPLLPGATIGVLGGQSPHHCDLVARGSVLRRNGAGLHRVADHQDLGIGFAARRQPEEVGEPGGAEENVSLL